MHLCVCIFSTAATWVGGAFIIGIAEAVYDPTKGLIWNIVPLQMSISFIIGKSLFNMNLNVLPETTFCWHFERHPVSVTTLWSPGVAQRLIMKMFPSLSSL